MFPDGKMLVVCPSPQVMRVWIEEAIRFFGSLFRILAVSDIRKAWGVWRETPDGVHREDLDACDNLIDWCNVVVLTTSALKCMWRLVRPLEQGVKIRKTPTKEQVISASRRVMQTRWTVTALDECHHVRNIRGAQLPKAFTALVPARLSMLLTGTPVVNSQDDVAAELVCLRCGDIPDYATTRSIVLTDPGNCVIGRHMLTIRKEHVSVSLPVGACAHPRAHAEDDQGSSADAHPHTEQADQEMALASQGEASDQSQSQSQPHPDPASAPALASPPSGWIEYAPGPGTVPPAFARRVKLPVTGSLDTQVFRPVGKLVESAFQASGSDRGSLILHALTLLRVASESVEHPSDSLAQVIASEGIARAGLTHPKPAWVGEYVRGMPAGEKAVVFCRFAGTVSAIRDVLEKDGVPCVCVTGETTAQDRDAAVDTFRTDPAARVLVATHVFSEGLNLQVANHVVIMSPWWNSKVDEQAVGRVHRHGQTKNVYVTWLTVAPESSPLVENIEDHMVDVCVKKLATVYQVDESTSNYTDRVEALGLRRGVAVAPRFCCDVVREADHFIRRRMALAQSERKRPTSEQSQEPSDQAPSSAHSSSRTASPADRAPQSPDRKRRKVHARPHKAPAVEHCQARVHTPRATAIPGVFGTSTEDLGLLQMRQEYKRMIEQTLL
jgi:hypothetical protein